jgi:predicted O-linked N-acetylglucosamine transferase (SPINDLY family)
MTDLPKQHANFALQAAITHHKAGRMQEAEQCYRVVLQIQPEHPEANHNLGVLAGQLGQHAAGLPYLKTALMVDPNQGQYVISYAQAMLITGQASEALQILQDAMHNGLDTPVAHALLQKILSVLPTNPSQKASLSDFPEVTKSTNKGQQNIYSYSTRTNDPPRSLNISPHQEQEIVAIFNAGRFAEAESYARALLELYPNSGFAWKALGTTLQIQGKEALSALQKAAELLPNDAEVHCNLGILFITLGRLSSAVDSYRRALKSKPDYVEAHNNLGTALKEMGQLGPAIESYRRAIQINPYFSEAHSNLLHVQNYFSGQSAAELLNEARRFGALAQHRARPYTQWNNRPEPQRRLRVGLISPDLRMHPVGYFVEGVLQELANQAAERIEIFAYYNHIIVDAQTERIKSSCQRWQSTVGLSDESLARRIYDDGIDILIDLAGHTDKHRLSMFAWKPAPIQISWLGYCATTGVAEIDYYLADKWTLPESEEAYFTEKIWRMPESYLCLTPPDAKVDVSVLPAHTNGKVTFGSFNNLTKMNDDVVTLWARILKALPTSCLYLKAKQFNEASEVDSVVKRFKMQGVEADRLILESTTPGREAHLATYQRMDIALDTFPYCGVTTTAEALWMGVPVLTLAGERFLSRQGAGMLTNVGLPEWIAKDEDDYVARAVSHASDLQRLAQLRNGLRQQVMTSSLFDAPRFARQFENALRDMWTQWCTHQQTGLA